MSVKKGQIQIELQKPKKGREGVPHLRLDLDFSPELVLDSVLFELALEDDLESHDEFGFDFACNVHVAESALAELLADLKVVEAPRLLHFRGGITRNEKR